MSSQISARAREQAVHEAQGREGHPEVDAKVDAAHVKAAKKTKKDAVSPAPIVEDSAD